MHLKTSFSCWDRGWCCTACQKCQTDQLFYHFDVSLFVKSFLLYATFLFRIFLFQTPPIEKFFKKYFNCLLFCLGLSLAAFKNSLCSCSLARFIKLNKIPRLLGFMFIIYIQIKQCYMHVGVDIQVKLFNKRMHLVAIIFIVSHIYNCELILDYLDI